MKGQQLIQEDVKRKGEKYVRGKRRRNSLLVVTNCTDLTGSGWRSRVCKRRLDKDELHQVREDLQLPAPESCPEEREQREKEIQ